MDTQIIALKCPSCGNTNNVAEKEINYGYEFTCKQCLTTSVLVINKQLYTPKPGEHICIVCGRVTASDVRFCQCGASLVRKCINPKCLKEFPVDHRLCDYCGWPQDVEESSRVGGDIKIQRAIKDLSDPDPKIQISACQAIAAIGPDAYSAENPLINIFASTNNSDLVINACNAFWSICAKSTAVIPILEKRLQITTSLYIVEAISLVYSSLHANCSTITQKLMEILEHNASDMKSEIEFDHALRIFKLLGSPVVPALVEFLDRNRFSSWDPRGANGKICNLLESMGSAASASIPSLLRHVEMDLPNLETSFSRAQTAFVTVAWLGGKAQLELVNLYARCSNEKERGEFSNNFRHIYLNKEKYPARGQVISPEIIPGLINLLRLEPHNRNTEKFVWYLVILSKPGNIPILIDIIKKNRDEKIQKLAYQCLIMVGESALSPLMELKEQPSTRKLSNWAIEEINRQMKKEVVRY